MKVYHWGLSNPLRAGNAIKGFSGQIYYSTLLTLFYFLYTYFPTKLTPLKSLWPDSFSADELFFGKDAERL